MYRTAPEKPSLPWWRRLLCRWGYHDWEVVRIDEVWEQDLFLCITRHTKCQHCSLRDGWTFD